MVHYVLWIHFKHINLKFWLYKLFAKQPSVTTNYHSYLITWQFNDVAHNKKRDSLYNMNTELQVKSNL